MSRLLNCIRLIPPSLHEASQNQMLAGLTSLQTPDRKNLRATKLPTRVANRKDACTNIPPTIAMYGTVGYESAEHQRIGDNWDSDKEKSISRFRGNAALLSGNTGGHLESILSLMDQQRKEVPKARDEGRDPAQAFSSISIGA
jgi:hypothetical protein